MDLAHVNTHSFSSNFMRLRAGIIKLTSAQHKWTFSEVYSEYIAVKDLLEIMRMRQRMTCNRDLQPAWISAAAMVSQTPKLTGYSRDIKGALEQIGIVLA